MTALATARAKANAAAALVSRLTIALDRAQQDYREAHTRALEVERAEARREQERTRLPTADEIYARSVFDD